MKRSTAGGQKVVLEKDSSSDEIQARFQTVHVLIKSKKYELAIEEMVHDDLRIRKRYAEFANHVWYCLGNIYFKTEQYEQAIRYFKKSIQIDPCDLDAWLALGNSYSQHGMYREAECSFFTILVISPNNHSAKYNLACANMDMGNYEKALFLFNKIQKKDERTISNLKLCKNKLNLKS